MLVNELNHKYQQLREYLISENLMIDTATLWVSHENLNMFSNILFPFLKLNHDSELEHTYLKLTYALVYRAIFSMPYHQLSDFYTFEMLLLDSYKNTFDEPTTHGMDNEVAKILYSHNILVKPKDDFSDTHHFIPIINSHAVNNETHVKYNNTVIIIQTEFEDQNLVSEIHATNIWYNLLGYNPLCRDYRLSTSEFDDYLKWLSDDDPKTLLSIFCQHIDDIIDEDIFECDHTSFTEYLNTIKQILVRNTKIADIDTRIDTALMLNIPLTSLIAQIVQPDINSLPLPEFIF